VLGAAAQRQPCRRQAVAAQQRLATCGGELEARSCNPQSNGVNARRPALPVLPFCVALHMSLIVRHHKAPGPAQCQQCYYTGKTQDKSRGAESAGSN
jgi:hypothetical protein